MIFDIKKRLDNLEITSKEIQEKLENLQGEIHVLRNETQGLKKAVKKWEILADTNSKRLSNFEFRLVKLEKDVYALNLELESLKQKLDELMAEKRVKKGKTKKKKETKKRRGK